MLESDDSVGGDLQSSEALGKRCTCHAKPRAGTPRELWNLEQSMPSNLYYFDPCAAGSGLRDLGKDYRLISHPAQRGKAPVWELPAVLLVDAAEDDLARVWKSPRRSPTLGGSSACSMATCTRPAKLKSRIFAMLPRDVSARGSGKDG